MTSRPLGHLDDPLGPHTSTAADRARTKALGRRRRQRRRLLLATPVVLLAVVGAVPRALGVLGGRGSTDMVQQQSATASPAAPAAGLTGTPHPAPTGPPGVRAAGCSTSALRIALGSPQGAAGSVYTPLTFTSTGKVACTLYGFPGVSFLDATGRQIGMPATRDPRPSALVALPPGRTAVSMLSVAQAANYPSQLCHGAPAAAIRIYPPGNRTAVVVPTPSHPQICTTPTQRVGSQLRVTPVSPQ
jgi:hypothetical protein